MAIFPQLVQVDMHNFKDMHCGMQSSNVYLFGSGDLPSSGATSTLLILSESQDTDLNKFLCFRHHCSPYTPNLSYYGLSSSHHRLCLVPEKATEVHSCFFSHWAPSTEAAETENLPNMDCSAADSSDLSKTSQQPWPNSISEMWLVFMIMKELNTAAYVVFKLS